MLEISHDHPIPDEAPARRRKSPGRSSIYPFDQMKPGDSFLIPGPITMSKRTVCFSAARSRGLKIRTKAEDAGLRVWLLDAWTPAKRLSLIQKVAEGCSKDDGHHFRSIVWSVWFGRIAELVSRDASEERLRLDQIAAFIALTEF